MQDAVLFGVSSLARVPRPRRAAVRGCTASSSTPRCSTSAPSSRGLPDRHRSTRKRPSSTGRKTGSPRRGRRPARDARAGHRLLPEELRVALVLRDVEGLSTADSASILEVSEAALKSRLHRARVLLRQWVADHLEAR